MGNTVFRKEIKYLISVQDYLLIQKKLACFLQPDAHGGPAGYMVRSLYFDSINDQDLYDTLDGCMEKRKIRLRVYDAQARQVKLEYKCKSNTDGVKKTLTLSREQAQDMMKGNYGFLAGMDQPLARQLYIRLCTGAYTPKSVVQYWRKAYLYPVSDVRITFDTQVAASNVLGSFLDAQPSLIPLLPLDTGVLEVKYNDFLPGVLKEQVARLDRLQTSNSKYAQSRLL